MKTLDGFDTSTPEGISMLVKDAQENDIVSHWGKPNSSDKFIESDALDNYDKKKQLFQQDFQNLINNIV